MDFITLSLEKEITVLEKSLEFWIQKPVRTLEKSRLMFLVLD